MKKVITYGSFDLFHEGHYRLLQRAKALGDYLIVGITTEHYDEERGKLNVVDSLMDRIENVKKTGFADQIIIEDHVGQKVEDILKYGVDIFTVGSDWTGKFDYLKEFCEVVYLERTKGVSSAMLRSHNCSILRLGIIGCGRIARRFLPEVNRVSGITTAAVYNPHIESARKFAQENDLEFYTDSLEEFYAETDAVYIAAPHQYHYEYIKDALLHHKHVLCEKPMVLQKVQAEEVFALAREQGVVLMEAIKTAYCPGFVQMMGLARSGIIGTICDVEVCFTRLTSPEVRELKDEEYGGSLTELGTYTLLPIIKLMGTDYKEIRFDSIKADNGLDLYTKTNLIYDKGFATMKNGLGVKSEGQLLIAGTKGYILAESPWWLTRTFEIRYEDPNKRDRYNVNFLGNGLRYEISDFVYMINGYEGRTFKMTAEESIAMADIMEQFLAKRRQERS